MNIEYDSFLSNQNYNYQNKFIAIYSVIATDASVSIYN